MYNSVIIEEKDPDQLPRSMADYSINYVNYRGVVKPDIYVNEVSETV